MAKTKALAEDGAAVLGAGEPALKVKKAKTEKKDKGSKRKKEDSEGERRGGTGAGPHLAWAMAPTCMGR